MTMREEFEADRRKAWGEEASSRQADWLLERRGEDYRDLGIHHEWRQWQAAYAAGQRAEALPKEPLSRDIVMMAGAILDQQFGTADSRHPWWSMAVAQAERAYAALFAIRNRKEQK